MGILKSSGVGNLTSPRVAGEASVKAIPPADEGVIRGMVSDAESGEDAGADGTAPNPKTAPGSQRTIPAPYRDALIPPNGYQVP